MVRENVTAETYMQMMRTLKSKHPNKDTIEPCSEVKW